MGNILILNSFIFVISVSAWGQNSPHPLTAPNWCKKGNAYTLDCPPTAPYFESYFLGASPDTKEQLLNAPPGKIKAAQQAVYDSTYAKNQLTDEIIPKVTAANTHPSCCTTSTTSISQAPGNIANSDPNSPENINGAAQTCAIKKVEGLPGSSEFGSDFIEAMADDPKPNPDHEKPNAVYALTADLSSQVKAQDQALFVSKSTDGGKTWTQVAKVDSRYFDAGIGEGLRNGLSVSPDGKDFVITTQKGAFQIVPQTDPSDPIVTPIDKDLKVAGNVVKMNGDGTKMYVGYGYHDKHPQIFTYSRAEDGSWKRDGYIPVPNKMDLLSLQLDPKDPNANSFYIGTGDQAYHYDPTKKKKWSQIKSVGGDSAVQGMTTVGGLHLATCWGVYNPSSGDAVKKITKPKEFLKIRSYGIEVDPLDPNREVTVSADGVYTSYDGGKNWKKLQSKDFPDTDYRTAHFNSVDGTIVVSGSVGTYVANPFSKNCN